MREASGFGFRFDVPVLASVYVPALVLTLAAAVAVFRFKIGTMKVLGACAAAGLDWGAAAGAV